MTGKVFNWILLFLLIIVVTYFRFYPKFLPYLDVAAKSEVYNAEMQILKKNINEKYPDIRGGGALNRLFKESIKSSKPQIDAKIAKRAAQLKDRYRDDNGSVYLAGIDSYYWFRLLDNLLKTGHVGDRIENGVEYDDLIGFPLDQESKKNAHVWLGLVFYKMGSFFNPGIALQEAVFFVPIFLSVLICILTFVVAVRCGSTYFGAFVASFAVNLSPFFMSRSITEWFDTDIYNIFFPLAAFGVFIAALQQKKLAKQIIFSACCGLLFALYASTWKGWWFIFDIMIISCLLFVLNQWLSRDESASFDFGQIKRQFYALGMFFAFSGIFITIFNGFSVWSDFITEPMRLVSIMDVTSQSIWPNVYQTVAELGKTDAFYLTSCLGSPAVFLTALLGILYIFLVERSVRDQRYGFGILCLVLWIISVFYIAMQASRFTLLLVVPAGLAFGLTVDKFYILIRDNAGRYFNRKTMAIIRYCFVILLSLYMASNIFRVHSKLIYFLPQMDDYWYNTLTKISKETPKDARINSWWDFGHWFKAIGGRRVLFDGMTQNTPYAYWMARTLLSQDEEKAVAILRMINTGDNKAVDILVEEAGLDIPAAVDIINSSFGKERQDAELFLKGRGLADTVVQKLLGLLFPEKLPPVYFIVSYDMITKIGPISYIGNWDFGKVDLWFKKKTMSRPEFLSYLMKRYKLNPVEAEDKYISVSMLRQEESGEWFSKPLGYFSPLSDSRADGKMLFFDNGLVVNLENGHAYIISQAQEQKGVPKSIVMLDGENLKIVSQENPDLRYSGLLVEDNGKYKSLLMDEEFAKSMLARLYFFKGKGLKHFKLYSQEADDKGNAIYVYEILWQEK